MGLLVIGFGFATLTSTRAATIAGLLIVAIVLYDAVLKSTPVAPALMGLCRALNLALGMHAASSLWTVVALTPIGLMWLYITSVTFFARHEAYVFSGFRPNGATECSQGWSGAEPLVASSSQDPAPEGRRKCREHLQLAKHLYEAGVSSRFRLTAGTVGVCAAVAGLSALAWIVPLAQLSFLWPLGLLLVGLGYAGFRAASRPSPQTVQAAVKTFVISLILFDTCIAWTARGPSTGLLVASLILPTFLLARALRVT